MRANEIEERILKFEMLPQEIALLQNAIKFYAPNAHYSVAKSGFTLDIGSVDLLFAEHFSEDFCRTEDDPSANLNDTSFLASFVNLCVKQVRIQHPTRCLARTTTAAFSWR